MRDIEEIEEDLKESQQNLDDEDAEVCFHQEKARDYQRDVDRFAKELIDAELTLINEVKEL
jgi:hypothetical protein